VEERSKLREKDENFVRLPGGAPVCFCHSAWTTFTPPTPRPLPVAGDSHDATRNRTRAWQETATHQWHTAISLLKCSYRTLLLPLFYIFFGTTTLRKVRALRPARHGGIPALPPPPRTLHTQNNRSPHRETSTVPSGALLDRVSLQKRINGSHSSFPAGIPSFLLLNFSSITRPVKPLRMAPRSADFNEPSLLPGLWITRIGVVQDDTVG
jgi:hypothetical protein